MDNGEEWELPKMIAKTKGKVKRVLKIVGVVYVFVAITIAMFSAINSIPDASC